MATFALAVAFAPAQAAPASNHPDLDQLRVQMWKKMRRADYNYAGVLRTKEKRYPFTLDAKGGEVMYTFTDKPLQIKVVGDEHEAKVSTRSAASEAWHPVSDLTKPILGTDLTYEDLALAVAYWKTLAPAGTDSFKDRETWVYEGNSPGKSQYAKAKLWITEKEKGIIKIDGYDSGGVIFKRLEVNDATPVKGNHIPTELVISTFKPGTEKSKSQTWIDIKVES